MFTCVKCRREEYSEGKSGWDYYDSIKKLYDNQENPPVCDSCLVLAEELYCDDCDFDDCPNYLSENSDSQSKPLVVGCYRYSLVDRYHRILQDYGSIK